MHSRVPVLPPSDASNVTEEFGRTKLARKVYQRHILNISQNMTAARSGIISSVRRVDTPIH